RTVIIARAWVTTGRTTEWLISVYLNTNMNRFLTLHKSDIGDRPGMSKSQYFGIECQFVHGNYSIFTHYDWGRATEYSHCQEPIDLDFRVLNLVFCITPELSRGA